MSDLNLFVDRKFRVYRGGWSTDITYKALDLVKAQNGSAYISNIPDNKGNSPETSPTAWKLFIDKGPVDNFSTGQIDRVSPNTFGINAGSTWNWKGDEWCLEKTDSQVTLVRVKQNCNCNCDCNCTAITTNCATDCNCRTDCTTSSNCNCNCTAITTNCAANCNCYSDCTTSANCNCNCTAIVSNCTSDCATVVVCDCDFGWCAGDSACDCHMCVNIAYHTNCDCHVDCTTSTNCNCNCTAITTECSTDCNCRTDCDASTNCNCNCTAI